MSRMPNPNAKIRICALLCALVLCPIYAAAQAVVDHDDHQSWNEFQISAPYNEQIDVFMTGTLRLGKNLSRVSEHRMGFGFAYKPRKDLSFSGSYLNIRARNSSGVFRLENRFVVYGRYAFPIKRFGLSHRSMFEWRLRSPRSSWRYRPSLTFEKEIPKKFIPGAKFFVTEEVFYDSALGRFSRNRFSLGIGKTINKKVSVDVYYLRQNDGFSVPGDLNVIGTSWKIKL